jgi:hypothetical protein
MMKEFAPMMGMMHKKIGKKHISRLARDFGPIMRKVGPIMAGMMQQSGGIESLGNLGGFGGFGGGGFDPGSFGFGGFGGGRDYGGGSRY